MLYEEVRAIVDRAAELLPAPPPLHFADLYASWEALTVDTGIRLAQLGGGDADLIMSLEDDEAESPADYRGRRRLLVHIMRLAALQMRTKASTARFQASRLPEGTILIAPARVPARALTR